MADGDLDLGAVTQPEEHDPIMPHLVMNAEDLDKHYPAMANPADSFMTEADYDEGVTDTDLERGLNMAKEIDEDTRTFGRTKYAAMMRPGMGSSSSVNAVHLSLIHI